MLLQTEAFPGFREKPWPQYQCRNYAVRRNLPDPVCNRLSVFLVGKQCRFDCRNFGALSLGRGAFQNGISEDEKAVVDDSDDVFRSADIHCLIAFAGSAFAHQGINFHVVLSFSLFTYPVLFDIMTAECEINSAI